MSICVTLSFISEHNDKIDSSVAGNDNQIIESQHNTYLVQMKCFYCRYERHMNCNV